MSEENERPTMVPCPMCKGARLVPVLLERPGDAGRYATTMRGCWLCGGVGSCLPSVISMWVASGRPEKKEDL